MGEDSPLFLLYTLHRAQLGEKSFELIECFVARVFHSFHLRHEPAV